MSTKIQFIGYGQIRSYSRLLKLIILLTFSVISFTNLFAQVGISTSSITPDASSILELRSTTSGFLLPRMTTAQRDAIASPATGLVIYNTSTNQLNYYSASSWQLLNTASGTVTSVGFTNGNGFTGTVSNATTTPTLSLTLQNATASQSGQLSSADWITFNNKGSGTVTSVATGYGLNGGTITTTGTLLVDSATLSTKYKRANDSVNTNGFTTLYQHNLKQNQLNGTGFVKATGTTISYDNSTYLTTASAGSTYEPLITASNTTKKYWNGYKSFVALNSDSLTEGNTNLFYTSARVNTQLSNYTGTITGDVTFSNGVSSIGSGKVTNAMLAGAIDLTTKVANKLPIANGGTNSNATPTSGAVAYGDGAAYQFSAAGTSNQILQSNGTAAPDWVDGGTMMFTGLSNGAVVSATTLYFPVMGAMAGVTTDASSSSRTLVSRTGTVTNLIVRISPALASGKTGSVTVYKNGVATSLVATLSVGPLTFTNLAANVSVVAGDELGIKVTTTGSIKVSWAADFTY